MRMLLLAGAFALVASPAFAHHKPNHSSFTSRTQVAAVARDPCQAGHRYRQVGGQNQLAQRCRELREALRAAPEDEALRTRCDAAAQALSGRACDD